MMAETTAQPLPRGVLIRQTFVAVGAMIAIPLLLYPRRLGFPDLGLNPLFSLLEWGFYFGVFTLAGARLSTSTRFMSAGFTVLARLVVGAALAVLVAVGHDMPWKTVAVEILWSYPVAVIVLVLLMPIVLRPVWEHLMGEGVNRGTSRRAVGFGGKRALVQRPLRRAYGSRAAGGGENRILGPVHLEASQPGQATLDDAVSYVGGYHGVRLCWIVDGEGLPLAVWQRQHYSEDAEYWAPISIEAADFHRRRLSVTGPCQPERIEVRTDLGRVIVESVGSYWLGVMTDNETDDLIGVRLGRARDMIAHYLQEAGRRYVGAGEAHYV